MMRISPAAAGTTASAVGARSLMTELLPELGRIPVSAVADHWPAS
jgi:hypothetical protein